MSSGSIAEARSVFERRFGLGLTELAALYAMPIWKGSAVGGNKWAQISVRVCGFLDRTPEDSAGLQHYYQEILGMEHNTGGVGDKLWRLKRMSDRTAGVG